MAAALEQKQDEEDKVDVKTDRTKDHARSASNDEKSKDDAKDQTEKELRREEQKEYTETERRTEREERNPTASSYIVPVDHHAHCALRTDRLILKQVAFTRQGAVSHNRASWIRSCCTLNSE